MEKTKEFEFSNNRLAWVKISNEQIKKFQEIYKKKFDIALSNKEALDYWIALVSFMKTSLYKVKK